MATSTSGTDGSSSPAPAKIEDSATFAMGLLYQFAAHSSGLALENATANSNMMNSVTNAGAAALTALKEIAGITADAVAATAAAMDKIVQQMGG